MHDDDIDNDIENNDADQDALPEITLRIPGRWESPQQLSERLPEGFSLSPSDAPERLILPDGSSVEFRAVPADDEFASVFAGACQKFPSLADRETIEKYKVNACLFGPGGSPESALRMLLAGAAIVRAGGAGVFIDNSGVAHGSDAWLKLASDPNNSPEGDWGGVFWAFVGTIGSESEVWSIGMHVLGYRDAIIPRTGNDEADHFTLNNFLGYTFQSGAPIADGDLLGDENAPIFRVHKEPTSYIPEGSPMHNPYGQWRLEHASKDELGDGDLIDGAGDDENEFRVDDDDDK